MDVRFDCSGCVSWNKVSLPHLEPFFDPHPDLLTMTKSDWEEITEEVFKDIFKKSRC